MSEAQIFNTFFDKIFVINLDHRTDRWNSIKKEFEEMGITNYERYSAVKPQFVQLPKEWYSRLVSPQRFVILGKNEQGQILARYNQDYICGSIGCKLSHYGIIKLAKERGYKNFLVFEDDVLFNITKDEVYKILQDAIKNLPTNWDMLYLSGNHMRPLTQITENLHRVSGTLTTHAYAMNSSIYDFALENMLNSGIEIDNYYWENIQTRGNSYTVKPTIVRQGAGYSDVLNRVVDYENIIT